MISTLLIVQIALAIAITIAVLLQKSSSIGLGAYSGSNESVFGAKGPTGFLAKLTFMLAFAFIISTLALGYLYTNANTSSIADSIVPANNVAVPSAPETVKNTAPAAPTSSSTVVASETPIEVPQSDSTTETNNSLPTTDNTPTTQENTTSSAPASN
jgi:preprotein translocase subunit SecG